MKAPPERGPFSGRGYMPEWQVFQELKERKGFLQKSGFKAF